MFVSNQAERLAALRAEVQKIERAGTAGAPAFMPLGVEAVDARIAGGGLAEAALHEVAGASCELADDAAATLFLAALAGLKSRAGGTRTQVIWALGRRDLFAPGAALAGLSPDRLIYAECRNDEEVLAVMEEGLRHGGLAAVVGEVGRCAMAAARRLQLAAEEGGTMALMLRRWRKAGREPLAEPSPAVTRWRIGYAPSVPLPVAGVGRACWRVELARQRGGESATWILEAPDAEARLALFSLAGDRADRAGRRAA
ncbi:MAG TPA: protein ImuA [Allosphingosinicella sp.]|jgi:protein ImuA